MGANMARRLKECGYPVAALYDLNRAGAQSAGKRNRRRSLRHVRASRNIRRRDSRS